MADAQNNKARKINFSLDEKLSCGAKIKVIGVGGGGVNGINRMISSKLTGVEFMAVNTDAQALKLSQAPIRFQIGSKLTKGRGAGSNPEIGKQAALEDTEKIIELLEGADMVFITAGLGGGTGTGASPVIASLAVELGALTVAIVTMPFFFEGRRRYLQAELGLRELRECVDTVIAIPNDKLLSTAGRDTSFIDAFLIADDILRQGVQGISDLVNVPGLINLDFADVEAVMAGMGMAIMGTGIAKGENKSIEAARHAISSPLLEDISIDGAKGVLINITGGTDLTLHEVKESSTLIYETAHEDANIILGAVIDEDMKDEIKLTVIATGFERENREMESDLEKKMIKFDRFHSSQTIPLSDSFYRRGKSLNKALDNQQKGTISNKPLEDKFDVPTFIREKR